MELQESEPNTREKRHWSDSSMNRVKRRQTVVRQKADRGRKVAERAPAVQSPESTRRDCADDSPQYITMVGEMSRDSRGQALSRKGAAGETSQANHCADAICCS